MNRKIGFLGLVVAAASLSGCATDGYGDGYGYGGLGWSSYPYSGWYDDYYGPLYDGYWGTDGYFYYRSRSTDHVYRRGTRDHFMQGQTQPSGSFHRFQGNMQAPMHGTRAPRFPRGGH